MADDANRLLSLQMAYERETENKHKFAGLSVNEFISSLLVEGYVKRAERVRADWRVPDKRSVINHTSPTEANDRFWWIKLKALASAGDWAGLETFAKSKKSPIGYEPFVVSFFTVVHHQLMAEPPPFAYPTTTNPCCIFRPALRPKTQGRSVRAMRRLG